MKRFKTRIIGWLTFCFIASLGYMAGAQAQFTPEQEAKINAAVKKGKEQARNLPANEKKLEWHLLKLVNKMTAENAKAQRDIPKKYGNRSTQIDEQGRIFVRIRCGSAADTLKIGERVKVVFHGQRAAGSYAEIWDGRNERGEIVASGVYIAKIQAGDFSATQKMLLNHDNIRNNTRV